MFKNSTKCDTRVENFSCYLDQQFKAEQMPQHVELVMNFQRHNEGATQVTSYKLQESDCIKIIKIFEIF